MSRRWRGPVKGPSKGPANSDEALDFEAGCIDYPCLKDDASIGTRLTLLVG
jgi:hypothetical protein